MRLRLRDRRLELAPGEPLLMAIVNASPVAAGLHLRDELRRQPG